MATPPTTGAHLRIARPADNIDSLRPFYITGLGFTVLYEFHDHSGFDGIILGHANAGYHQEFTTKRGQSAGRAPTDDNLLVFYLPDENQWREAVARMIGVGARSVRAANPYWEVEGKGRTFEDADAWRVVLWRGGWENEEVRARFERMKDEKET